MKIGAIVRRRSTSEDKYLYGPYMIVTDISDGILEVCRICCGSLVEEEGQIDKSRVEEIPCSKIRISEKDIDILLKENPDFYYHNATIAWCHICDASREILILSDKKHRCIIYANSSFDRVVRKKTISVSKTKYEKDIIENTPLIKVSLGEKLYEDHRGDDE